MVIGDKLIPFPHDWMNKPIAEARHSLQKARRLGVVMQRCAKLMDGGIESAFNINGCACRPHSFAQRGAGDEFAGCFQKRFQQLRRL